MNPDLAIILAQIVLVVGAGVGLVNLGGNSADAKHREEQFKENQRAGKAYDRYRSRGGLRAARRTGVRKSKRK